MGEDKVRLCIQCGKALRRDQDTYCDDCMDDFASLIYNTTEIFPGNVRV